MISTIDYIPIPIIIVYMYRKQIASILEDLKKKIVFILKHLYARNDYEGERFEMKYLRTKDKKEIDFCLTNNNEIVEVLEVKNRDSNISKNLKYFCQKYGLKRTQIVKELMREKEIEKISVRNAHTYLKELIL